MRTFSDAKFPPGGFDAFLIERKVIESLVNLNEVNSSLAAQVLWAGYKTSSITYIKKERAAGISRWSISKKLRLTLDSIMSFSRLPVRLMELAGLTAAVSGGGYAIFLIYFRMTKDVPIQGWTSLMVVLLVISGLGFLSLGIICEYLWRILDASRRRPVYLVADERNFNNSLFASSVIRKYDARSMGESDDVRTGGFGSASIPSERVSSEKLGDRG